MNDFNNQNPGILDMPHSSLQKQDCVTFHKDQPGTDAGTVPHYSLAAQPNSANLPPQPNSANLPPQPQQAGANAQLVQQNNAAVPLAGQYGNMYGPMLSPQEQHALAYEAEKKIVEKSIGLVEHEEKKRIDLDAEKRRQEIRQHCKEISEENKKCRQELVKIDKNGTVTALTANVQIPVRPRQVTNMERPILRKYIRIKNPNDLVYKLTAFVDGKEREVYLDGRKIGKHPYLLERLLTQGIVFTGRKSQKEDYVMKLFSVLFNEMEEYIVPDDKGWSILDNEKIIYNDGRLTWKILLKKSRS